MSRHAGPGRPLCRYPVKGEMYYNQPDKLYRVDYQWKLPFAVEPVAQSLLANETAFWILTWGSCRKVDGHFGAFSLLNGPPDDHHRRGAEARVHAGDTSRSAEGDQ
jgi:hypothetical protein